MAEPAATWAAALALFLLPAAGSAGAQAEAEAGAEADGPVAAARAAQLERMVRQDCGSCHGLTLKGGLGRPITPQALAGRDPQGLAAIVLDGIPGTAMPPWRPLLSDDEANWIARYLLKGSAP